jgi:transcriptional regulator with XRE-family HTH domain
MYIAERLRRLREVKKLSQGDIEKRTGLLRCYISRIENGHTAPAVETLEKLARALEVPMYQLLYSDQDPPTPAKLSHNAIPDWASRGRGQRLFSKLQNALARASNQDRALLLTVATKMVSLGKSRKG